ncbi:EAL domain-containing protein [Granulicella sp. WH15]|uniref:bifunctional diguanylate cyclase/phosphodiesterase n=1 Tax=Granulicella sp. WH15 TaxID=2602070 RepID=UPI0013678900|nr:EAL domain-containing protein [Granulicella sp. WH15]QHN04293.1 EAL domain-containing protein [Granulicella sp. WH15]
MPTFFIQDSDSEGAAFQSALSYCLSQNHPTAHTTPAELSGHAEVVLDLLSEMIWTMRPDGSSEYFNRRWNDYTGSKAGEPGLGNWLNWVHPDDYCEVLSRWTQSNETDSPFVCECRLRHRSGDHRWFLVQARAQHNEYREVIRWLGSCTDIQELRARQQALEENTRLQRDMLDISVDCIKVINPDGSLAAMNKSGCVALGVSEDSGFGMRWLNLLPKEVHNRGGRALAMARQGKNARFPGLSQLPGQKPQYWDNILTPLVDEHGRTTAIFCVSREVTLQREAERRLRIASEIDSLTGLLNRRSLRIKLRHLIKNARRTGEQFGFLLIDLDHFKQVNDTLGHPAGDHLLQAISRRLKTSFSDSGIVARLGGDEFAIIIRNIRDEEDVRNAAGRALSQMTSPITYNGNQINGGMSIGCALFPRDAQDIETLSRCGDAALKELKANGRGGFRIFDARMMETIERAVAQFNLAAQILHNRVIEPRYQPKINLPDFSVIGFEALLSWRDPESGLQPASTLAETYRDYELATQLSCHLRKRVFSDMAAWKKTGTALLPISMNAAPAEFLRDDFAERLLRDLDKFHIEPSLIEIEITELALFARGSEFIVRALRKLREYGIRIVLDNFGTGCSSLAQLGDYPVDALTIDRTFVQRMHSEKAIDAIVQAIGMLASSLSLDVIAKGIENECQYDMLRGFGCLTGQGLYFGPLLSSAETMRALPKEQVAAP